MSDRLLLYKYMGNSCQHCGTTVEEKLRAFRSYACFELHHIDPAKKSPEYDNLIRRNFSSEQLDEVDKCALLCGNCHDTLHGQNLRFDVTFLLQAEGIEPIEHVLPCQVIYDYEKQEGVLFSDEFNFLDLYRVQLGGELPSIMSGLQLKPLFDPLVERTRTDGDLVIATINGIPIFKATRLNETECEWTTKPEFPFVPVELSFMASTGKNWTIFLRSGHFISTGNHRIFFQTYGRMTLNLVTKYRTATDTEQK